jgi:hypothetical protein
MTSKPHLVKTTADAVLHLERSTQRLWTAGIIGFFSLQALLWTVAIWLTARDPSFAVHPNYEARAEGWDAVVRTTRASELLGWKLSIVAPAERSNDEVAIVLSLADENGQPVSGADIEVRLFHQARAGHVQQLRAMESTPGSYGVSAILDRPGLWRFVGQAHRGESLFLIDQTERL